MTEAQTDLLSDLVRGKRSCLVQLRDMGRRQLDLIEEGDIARLLDLLVAKQRVIDQLQRLERALDPFRRQDPEARVWRSPQHRQRCADAMQQCEAMLAEIIGQEKCGEAMLARRRNEAAERLHGVRAAQAARGAYLAEPAEAISQLDLSTG